VSMEAGIRIFEFALVRQIQKCEKKLTCFNLTCLKLVYTYI